MRFFKVIKGGVQKNKGGYLTEVYGKFEDCFTSEELVLVIQILETADPYDPRIPLCKERLKR